MKRAFGMEGSASNQREPEDQQDESTKQRQRCGKKLACHPAKIPI